MPQFLKFIFGIELYMFRTVSLSIVRSLAQRNCPKHVEFYSKNKFEKLGHLVGFIIIILRFSLHKARSYMAGVEVFVHSLLTSTQHGEYLATRRRRSFPWLLVRSMYEIRSFSARFGGKMNPLPPPPREQKNISSDGEPIVYSLHGNINMVLNPSAWGHLNPSSYCDVGRLFYGVFKLWSKLERKKMKK